MKIVFIHYHLKTGGVTAVLRQQIESMLHTSDLLLLTGAPPDASFPCETVHIPGLGYDKSGPNRFEPEKVADAIIKAIRLKWDGGCDLIHVHNPTLAKNRNFLKILKTLQKEKFRLFLQIHDFAEDGRPLAYFSEDDYVSDCHYGVINSRDYNILLKAGLKKEGLHKIFNTITPLNFKATGAIPKNYILYPVRAIRRKNIGEAILLSLFFTNDETLAITLPPNSPADIKSHERWKAFVDEKHLDIIFEAGLTHEFPDLVLSANFLITTSITEGFGFSFLEPWTAEKLLWGRRLPQICQDFEKNGIQLDHLYSRLNVPVEWIGKERLFKTWKLCVQRAGSMFDLAIDETAIKNAFEKTTDKDIIDFGLLDESFQKTVISKVLSDSANRDALIHLNPYLSNPGDVSNRDALIQNNLKAVKRHYNQTRYRKNLLDIYTRVIRDNVHQKIDKKILFSEFFSLDNFSLLKWSSYAEK
jgi:glycosyltransferase involved in cell wall biosynthesis